MWTGPTTTTSRDLPVSSRLFARVSSRRVRFSVEGDALLGRVRRRARRVAGRDDEQSGSGASWGRGQRAKDQRRAAVHALGVVEDQQQRTPGRAGGQKGGDRVRQRRTGVRDQTIGRAPE